jgi:hypothetical protein
MELASCHSRGTYNFEVAPRFLENLWTSALGHKYWILSVWGFKISEWIVILNIREGLILGTFHTVRAASIWLSACTKRNSNFVLADFTQSAFLHDWHSQDQIARQPWKRLMLLSVHPILPTIQSYLSGVVMCGLDAACPTCIVTCHKLLFIESNHQVD